jgi:hypothetical protein
LLCDLHSSFFSCSFHRNLQRGGRGRGQTADPPFSLLYQPINSISSPPTQDFSLPLGGTGSAETQGHRNR